MSQPSNWGMQTSGPASPDAVAARVNDSLKALLNQHKGGSAPSYREAGTLWLDDSATPWAWKFWDGSQWVAIGTLNATTHNLTLAPDLLSSVGLGTTVPTEVTDLNAITLSGLYRATSTATGNPNTGATLLVEHKSYNSNQAVQIAYRHSSGLAWKRFKNAGVWGNWFPLYSGENILGTVSMLGGLPNGGIIERGSNSQGAYTRFADGTQICTQTLSMNLAAAAGYADSNYPAAFTSIASGAWSADKTSAGANMGALTNCYLATGTTAWSFYRPGGGASTINVYLSAIGTWN